MSNEDLIDNLKGLPGGEILIEGLRDLENNQFTLNAYLTLIGAPRLRLIGIKIPNILVEHPEHKLYELLEEQNLNQAHSRYNALIRRLISLERALEGIKSSA